MAVLNIVAKNLCQPVLNIMTIVKILAKTFVSLCSPESALCMVAL